jgi:hypothetical protein
MPSHGVEIIDGIPVILRNSVMYSFHPNNPSVQTVLGEYDTATKTAKWVSSDKLSDWLTSFRESLAARSRK